MRGQSDRIAGGRIGHVVCTSPSIEERSSGEHNPAQNSDGGKCRRKRVAEQRGGNDCAAEGCKIRDDVVDGGDEWPIDDVGDGDEDAASERDRQESLDHRSKFALVCRQPRRETPYVFVAARVLADPNDANDLAIAASIQDGFGLTSKIIPAVCHARL